MLLNHQKWSLKFKIVGINENELFSVKENCHRQGVDKTWGKPWCRSWPNLWPTLWPTGGQIFKNIKIKSVRVEQVRWRTILCL